MKTVGTRRAMLGNVAMVGLTLTATTASAQTTCTADAGLVAYYPFDGNANDATGHGHNGMVSGAALVADRAGNPNSAYFFDGSAIITVPADPAFAYDETRGLTLVAWARRTGAGVPQHLLGERVGCAGGGPFWQLALGGSAMTEAQLPINEWTHIVMVMSSGSATYYINGALSSVLPAFSGSFNLMAPFLIGGSGGCARFVGVLDEVRVYDRALAAAEAQALFTGGPCCPTLTMQPVSQTVCHSGAAMFTTAGAGGPGLVAYQWRHAGLPLANAAGHVTGAQTAALTILNAVPADAGPYDCIVSNACGGTTSSPAVLTVCVADFDNGSGIGLCDGGVTIDDLLYYIRLYTAGSARADIDNGTMTGAPDGGVTIDDLLYFLTRYAAGC